MSVRGMLIAVTMILLGLAGAAYADGMLIPVRPMEPAFTVKYHNVDVTIDRQVATTKIDQVFHNESPRQLEAEYIFPIPPGATISKFSMYVGGEELTGRLLSKEEARRIYEEIVRKRQDPALLEYMGREAIRARVFPIPPNEDRKVVISYQEVVKRDGLTCKYVYPLSTEKLSNKPLERVSVDIAIKAQSPISNIYSPTHDLSIKRESKTEARASYSAKGVKPDMDLVLYYSVSEEELVGLSMITYREPGEEGFFLLMASPTMQMTTQRVMPKDVLFVLDTSGSMAGDGKIDQAKSALRFCLNSLGERDRFNIVAFNTEVRTFRPELVSNTKAAVGGGEEFVAGFQANGGTNLNQAMLRGLEMLDNGSRVRTIIFLTDGQPTVGETNTDNILANVGSGNKHKARLFAFGVGYDVNAHFLDRLADGNGGISEYVRPKEDIEVKVSSLYSKISSPLLTDLKLNWGHAKVHDVYPQELPDLFQGTQLVVVGRYDPEGNAPSTTTITLTGEVNGEKQRFDYKASLPARARHDEFVPRLWAARKIGYLLDEIRLHGSNKELVEEVVRLSKDYGIMTEYTSFLVDLDTVRGAAAAGPGASALGATGPAVAYEPLAALLPKAAERMDTARGAQSGGWGVNQAGNLGQMKRQGQVYQNWYYDANGNVQQIAQVRNVNVRTFYQNGAQWVDAQFKTSQNVTKVKAYSPAYFQLANASPRLAQYLSLGNEVLIGAGANAVQVTANEGQEKEFAPAELKKLLGDLSDVSAEPAKMIARHSGAPTTVPIAIAVAVGLVACVTRRPRRWDHGHSDPGC